MLNDSRHVLSRTEFLCWAGVVAIALYVRPLSLIDETRYISVAWEMWQRNDFLVPFLNGAPYSHKPPLFFWIIQAGWWAFGVNELTPRLTAPLFGVLNLVLVRVIACRLWPESRNTWVNSPLILMSFLLWSFYTTLTMFDMLLTFFVLIGICGLLNVRDNHPGKGWILLGLAISGGLLTKGPVLFLYLLPVLMLASFWAREAFRSQWRGWLLGSLVTLVIGTALALCWALPAVSEGGKEYGQAIFLNQAIGRISQSFAHQRPFWWYLPILPVFFFPWTFIPPAWMGIKKLLNDPGSRFCLSWVLPQFLLLSLVSGKQIHYLLPIAPAVALLFSRSIDLASGSAPPRGQKLIAVILFLISGCLLALPKFSDSLGLPEISFVRGIGLLLPTLTFATAYWLMIWKPGSWTHLNRNLCITVAVLIIAVHAAVFGQVSSYFDFSPMANEIALLQEQGTTVAHMGKYHDQFQFLGRLKKPLVVLDNLKVLHAWSDNNPDSVVVYYQGKETFPTDKALFYQSFRFHKLMGLFRSDELVTILEKGTASR